MELRDFFRKNPRVAVAFSGGVDSGYLLYETKKYAEEFGAYFVKSPFQPEFELEDALRLCELFGVTLNVLEIESMPEKILENTAERCYYCKKEIFSMIKTRAEKDGFSVIVDGTNATDDENDRPGMRAIRELGVRSPLKEYGLSKQEIRDLSRDANLFTSDKPAYSCLATRIPKDTRITPELLERIERAENALFKVGLSGFRVRLMGECARLELTAAQLANIIYIRQDIIEALSPFFEDVFIDIKSVR